MKIKQYKYLLFLLVGFVLTILAYNWFSHSLYYSTVLDWASRNVLLLDISLVLVKIIAIVWPPIPGVVFSFAAIPVLGWVHVLLIDSLGNILGCIITYWLARIWGLPFLEKIFDDSTIKKLRSIRTIEHREIEGLVILRIFSSTIAELTSYGAGLLRVNFKNFLIAIVLSNFIVGIPLFYFADRLFRGSNYLITLISLIVAAVIFYFFRKRYFYTKRS